VTDDVFKEQQMRMQIKFLFVLAAVTMFASGGMALVRPLVAQAPTSVTTKSGILVEEVRVGGSCVVIATYKGISNEVAVTPCHP
jgi:hypothetical protein